MNQQQFSPNEIALGFIKDATERIYDERAETAIWRLVDAAGILLRANRENPDLGGVGWQVPTGLGFRLLDEETQP
jgi:hypothetical protein